MRALWIEILRYLLSGKRKPSRPVRALWIEITVNLDGRVVYQSRPVRALWIEIPRFGRKKLSR